jgi:hypothetical protein
MDCRLKSIYSYFVLFLFPDGSIDQKQHAIFFPGDDLLFTHTCTCPRPVLTATDLPQKSSPLLRRQFRHGLEALEGHDALQLLLLPPPIPHADPPVCVVGWLVGWSVGWLLLGGWMAVRGAWLGSRLYERGMKGQAGRQAGSRHTHAVFSIWCSHF